MQKVVEKKEYDVFISYSVSDFDIVKSFVSSIRAEGYQCFFAKSGENDEAEFAKSINKAIGKAEIFVIFLSHHVLKKPTWLIRELETKINLSGLKNVVPFLLEGTPKDYRKIPLFRELLENVDYVSNKEKLINKINKYFPDKEKRTRKQAKFYDKKKNINQKEIKRLSIQSSFLSAFAGRHFYEAIGERKDLAVLDVGCGKTNYFLDFIESGKVKYLLGLDKNQKCIDIFNETKTDTVEAKLCDITTDELDVEIKKYLKANNLKGFDIINISMVLLFLKSNDKCITLLKSLYKYLNKGGHIFITTIDDDLIIAYPDPNRLYQAVKRYSIEDEVNGGYRKTGRQVPYFLNRAGFKDISLLENGLNTLGKDKETLAVLFEMCILYFENDYDLLRKNSTKQEEIDKGNEVCDFFEKHTEELRKEFLSDGFFCNIGFLLFSGRK